MPVELAAAEPILGAGMQILSCDLLVDETIVDQVSWPPLCPATPKRGKKYGRNAGREGKDWWGTGEAGKWKHCFGSRPVPQSPGTYIPKRKGKSHLVLPCLRFPAFHPRGSKRKKERNGREIVCARFLL